ncbi:MAG: polysaccharide deacetylase family protein [Pyrinomonadaceae bacterium]
MKRFRILIFSSMSPPDLLRLLRRLALDLPEVEICGVLYEHPRPPLALKKRIRRAAKLLRQTDFLRFVAHQAGQQLQHRSLNFFDKLLRTVHAAPANPNGTPVSLEELAHDCLSKGISFHVTDEIHAEESLSFVRELQADLGLIYGTRILKAQLFNLPRKGSINIHQHKVPEYRGGGPAGIWELRDGKREATVTVHRVTQAVDGGNILGERTFAIDPFDTLESVGLKADVLSLDLITEVLRAESLGSGSETPQPAEGTVYKGYQPHQLFAIERKFRAEREKYKVVRGRPFHKLAVRALAYPKLLVQNRRRRKQGNFPIVILYHHVITDKPKAMGLSTGAFARHVRFLKKHYRIVSLPEALKMLRAGRVDAPTVVLTFDDGYAENFLCLRAVAEAENIPVTHFVCTQRVAEGAEFDHDTEVGERGFTAFSWEQIRYMERHGATIGSHTRNHLDCGSRDTALLAYEIAGSHEDLEKELGHASDYFAFPKGHRENISGEAMELAKESYPYIFSAYGGVNYGPLSAPCEVYRCAHPASLWELELLLQSVLEFPIRSAPAQQQPAPRAAESLALLTDTSSDME